MQPSKIVKLCEETYRGKKDIVNVLIVAGLAL